MALAGQSLLTTERLLHIGKASMDLALRLPIPHSSDTSGFGTHSRLHLVYAVYTNCQSNAHTWSSQRPIWADHGDLLRTLNLNARHLLSMKYLRPPSVGIGRYCPSLIWLYPQCKLTHNMPAHYEPVVYDAQWHRLSQAAERRKKQNRLAQRTFLAFVHVLWLAVF